MALYLKEAADYTVTMGISPFGPPMVNTHHHPHHHPAMVSLPSPFYSHHAALAAASSPPLHVSTTPITIEPLRIPPPPPPAPTTSPNIHSPGLVHPTPKVC